MRWIDDSAYTICRKYMGKNQGQQSYIHDDYVPYAFPIFRDCTVKIFHA